MHIEVETFLHIKVSTSVTVYVIPVHRATRLAPGDQTLIHQNVKCVIMDAVTLDIAGYEVKAHRIIYIYLHRSRGVIRDIRSGAVTFAHHIYEILFSPVIDTKIRRKCKCSCPALTGRSVQFLIREHLRPVCISRRIWTVEDKYADPVGTDRARRCVRHRDRPSGMLRFSVSRDLDLYIPVKKCKFIFRTRSIRSGGFDFCRKEDRLEGDIQCRSHCALIVLLEDTHYSAVINDTPYPVMPRTVRTNPPAGIIPITIFLSMIQNTVIPCTVLPVGICFPSVIRIIAILRI